MPRSVPSVFLLAFALVTIPTVALAAGATLTATVVPGHEIDLVGAGFPASTPITLSITRTGSCATTPCDPHAGSGTRTVTSDARGAFTAVIDAGPGRGGRYVIVATAGSVSASADVVAVETAGGLAPGAKATLPPTDMAPAAQHDGAPPWPAMLALVLGLAVLIGVASAVGRTSGMTERHRG